MKVDFKNKIIEIDDEIKVKELLELIDKHSLKDFKIIPKEKENIYVPIVPNTPWIEPYSPCSNPYQPTITYLGDML